MSGDVCAGLTIAELFVGQRASLSRTFTEEDVSDFAELSGDRNPLHLDAGYAATTQFGQRIVHGMLVASLISTVQAMRLPGPGNIYVRQSLKFAAPVHLADTITATVEVVEIDGGRNRVFMSTRCVNQHGTLVVDGRSELIPRVVPSRDRAPEGGSDGT